VLINKALIEIPPMFAGRPPVYPGAAETRLSWPGATGLAEDVRRYGQWMRDEAEKSIGHLYPKAKLPDGTEATVIAWIWARTVTCPNPACGGTMPLVRSFWLGKKKGKERWVNPVPDGKTVRFEIEGPSGAPRDGTVNRNGATCLLCGTPVPLAYIRAEGHAGRMGVQLMAIAAEGKRQRYYLPPNDEHEIAATVPRPDDVPDAEIPHNPRYLTAPNYGMRTWADLFTSRQLTALTTFTDLVKAAHVRVLADTDDSGYARAVATYLGLVCSRIIERNTAVGSWDAHPSKEQVRGVFARQAIAMTWDFAEANPLSGSSGTLGESVEWVSNACARLPATVPGEATQADAATTALDHKLVATDPPYYDNVGYADLSDLFYVWLRRSMMDVHPDLAATLLTPKADELVADPFRHDGNDAAREFFEAGFQKVFAKIRESSPDGFPISVFYAYKQAETDDERGRTSTGWETLLEAMLSGGWAITGTWPVRTELANRPRSLESNALASSVVLACRPRHADAPVSDRRGLIAALRDEMPAALQQLERARVSPVDMPQAVLGPGMAVFSRHSRVNEPDGSRMSVHSALNLIDQVVGEIRSRLEADLGPDTRWCLDWFKAYGFGRSSFDDAQKMARGRGIGINGLEHAGLLQARAGKAWLTPLADLPENYDPRLDDRVSEWKVLLHLAKRLAAEGAEGAAPVLASAQSVVDLDAVRDLAYSLYPIAEKRWPDVALLFNSLATSWSDLAEAARRPASAGLSTQGQLDLETDEG